MADPTHDEAAATVLALSERQLAAYNRADLDAFCACYHPQVRVLGEDGAVSLEGMTAFRARYGAMFAAHEAIEARVSERMLLGPHVVEREHWSRVDRASGERRSGEVFVRYTARDGLLAIAEFLSTGATARPARRGARVLVIAGTGTDVGKTHVSAALLRCARTLGLRARGYKPVATGVTTRCDDAEAHAQALDAAVEPCTFSYEPPVSPHLAARLAGARIELAPVCARVEALAAQCDLLVVELAGGLFTPLGPALDNAALTAALEPTATLLVAPDRLGVLHDVGACMHAARARALHLDGCVLSAPPVDDASTGQNARELEALGLARVAAVFARAPVDDPRTQHAALRLAEALSLTPGR